MWGLQFCSNQSIPASIYWSQHELGMQRTFLFRAVQSDLLIQVLCFSFSIKVGQHAMVFNLRAFILRCRCSIAAACHLSHLRCISSSSSSSFSFLFPSFSFHLSSFFHLPSYFFLFILSPSSSLLLPLWSPFFFLLPLVEWY